MPLIRSVWGPWIGWKWGIVLAKRGICPAKGRGNGVRCSMIRRLPRYAVRFSLQNIELCANRRNGAIGCWNTPPIMKRESVPSPYFCFMGFSLLFVSLLILYFKDFLPTFCFPPTRRVYSEYQWHVFTASGLKRYKYADLRRCSSTKCRLAHHMAITLRS